MVKIIDIELSQEELLERALNELPEGADTTPSSNIYKIFKALINKNSINKINSIIQSINPSTKKGAELDEFYGTLFGNKRMIDTLDEDITIFRIQTNLDITIEAKEILKYNKNFYTVYADSLLTVKDDDGFATISCINNYSNPPFVENGIGDSFFFNSLESKYTDIDLTETLLIDVVELDENKEELDSEYRARATGLLQQLGQNNIELITKKIKKINGVVEVLLAEGDFHSVITIIPQKLESLEGIKKAAQEIVNYYKSSNITISSPILIKFFVSGVLEQFAGHTELVKSAIKNYIEGLRVNGSVFNRDNFENLLYDLGNNYIGPNFILNEDKIKVEFDICSGSDYNIPTGEKIPIFKNTIRAFKNAVFAYSEI